MAFIAWTRQHLLFRSSLITENPIKFPLKIVHKRPSWPRFTKSGKITVLFPNLGQRIAVVSRLTAWQKATWLALCPFSKSSTWHGEHRIAAMSHRIILSQKFSRQVVENPQRSKLAQNKHIFFFGCRLVIGAMPPFNYTGHLHLVRCLLSTTLGICTCINYLS